jgi:polyphenol oxidase
MSLPDPFRAFGQHLAIELPGARAVFTTRRGGVSRGPFATLNLGKLTPDDPEAVEENRERLRTQLGVQPTMIRQVHGTRVLRVAEAPRDGRFPEADGQATFSRAIAPMVLVADCLPIALAGDGAVAMLHAGWRGLADGIIREGVGAVRELGGVGQLTAAIGPGAGVCCYEVGPEVHERFAAYGDAVRRGEHLDMKAIAREQLERAGVEIVHDVGLCTICSGSELFYSHRRDRGLTGRQAGVAWLT